MGEESQTGAGRWRHKKVRGGDEDRWDLDHDALNSNARDSDFCQLKSRQNFRDSLNKISSFYRRTITTH